MNKSIQCSYLRTLPLRAHHRSGRKLYLMRWLHQPKAPARVGIARIQCTNPQCKEEFFRPFSCKGFHLCPSCSQKRTLLFAEYVANELLLRLPHRLITFSLTMRTSNGEGGATTAHACTLKNRRVLFFGAGRAKIKTLAAEWTEVFIPAGWIGSWFHLVDWMRATPLV